MKEENLITSNNDVSKKPSKHYLTTVTPLSKYLAMILFVVLPFLGFYIGLNLRKDYQALGQNTSLGLNINDTEPDKHISRNESKDIPAFKIADVNNSDFRILNDNYLISNGTLYYLKTNVIGWMNNITDDKGFQSFLSNSPSELDDIKPFFIKMISADISYLKLLSNNNYISDKNNVYFAGNVLNGVTTSTVRIIGGALINGNNVYFGMDKIETADASTFSFNNCKDLGGDFPLLSCERSYRDKNNVFFVNYRSNKITIIDRSTFKHATSSYFVDKNDVYLHVNYIETNELLPLGANPKTFELLSNGFSRDSKNLYYALNGTWSNNSPILIDNGDPDSFEDLSGPYAKDKNNVYFGRRPHEGFASCTSIKGADQASFKVITFNQMGAFAKDSNNVYYDNKVYSEPDINTVQTIAGMSDVIMDKNNLYVGGWSAKPSKVEGIDAQTFRITNPKFTINNYGKVSTILGEDDSKKYKIELTDNEYRFTTFEEIK